MASSPPSLRLIVSQDTRHPAGGYAMLVLQGASRAPGDLRLVIRRRQPPEHFLGPEGWQPTTAEILAEGQEREGGTTALLLGPAIVDHIKPYAKLEILVPSLGQQGTLIWPELRQSPEGYLPTGGYVAGGVLPQRGEKTGIKPPELPRREPTLDPPAEAPTDPLPEPPVLAAEPKTTPPRRKPARWPWLLLLLLLVAGGLAAWQYIDRGPERLACSWGLFDCTVDPCPPTMPLEERQACLVKSLTPDELFELAEKLGGEGDKVNRDLAWWLFSTLADRSYSRAERELGLCYDPLLPEGCSLQPRLVANARQALQHYRAGGAEAEAKALCEWLQPRGDLESQAAFAEFCK